MPAITELKEIAGERSRYQVVVSVLNLAGSSVQPSSLKWTLTDTVGNIRNNRDRVSILSPSADHPILLYGNDLSVFEDTEFAERRLLIEATYTEGELTGIPYTHEYRFKIRNFVGISGETSKETLYDADGNVVLDADGNVVTSG